MNIKSNTSTDTLRATALENAERVKRKQFRRRTQRKIQTAYNRIKATYAKIAWIDGDEQCLERQLSASDLIRLALKDVQCRGFYPNEKDLLRELELY